MNVFIWIDDERDLPSTSRFNRVEVAHNFNEAISLLSRYFQDESNLVYIDFDHDLGEGRTGYDIAKEIVKSQFPCENVRYRIHSMNPVGRANIEQLLSHYGYKKF